MAHREEAAKRSVSRVGERAALGQGEGAAIGGCRFSDNGKDRRTRRTDATNDRTAKPKNWSSLFLLLLARLVSGADDGIGLGAILISLRRCAWAGTSRRRGGALDAILLGEGVGVSNF